ncbi:hypothetical protein HMPREF0018_00012 [Acinetobacter radioresistens SH164]|jgi:hypothetical protein|nr:hypothetical protein HMPREF0018_00012 [Acinetobacter radioresistens SH164]
MRTDWRRGESMSALTMMNMSMHEEAMIPKLAIQAFRHAFEQACASSEVVYTEQHKLVKHLPDGEKVFLKDTGHAYQSIQPQQRQVMKRRKKQETAI